MQDQEKIQERFNVMIFYEAKAALWLCAPCVYTMCIHTHTDCVPVAVCSTLALIRLRERSSGGGLHDDAMRCDTTVPALCEVHIG